MPEASLLSRTQAAKYAGVHPTTIDRWGAAGWITRVPDPFRKHRTKYRPEDLDKLK